MPRTTQCPNCGVVLNLPELVAGKKLKCPRCSARFSPDGSIVPRTDSKTQVPRPPGQESSLLLTTRKSEAELSFPEGDLRDTFSSDLLHGEDTPIAGAGTGGKSKGGEADAAELFREERPRKPATAGPEARAKPRRCPNCTSVVPAGMSLCNHCGLDLDTGQRHHLDEIFDEPVTSSRPSGPPLIVSILGGITLLVSLLLLLLALVNLQDEDSETWVTLSLAAVGGFGMYGAIQFLRMKSIKMLITALLLAAALDITLLIAYPIVDVSSGPVIKDPLNVQVTIHEDMPVFASREERLQSQMWKINWGIVILLVNSGLIIYLLTGGVKNHFERRPSTFRP